jgi:hypothetical protein
MNTSSINWEQNWSEKVKEEKDQDWLTEWERGYIEGMYRILALFEKELYIATKQDPQYAVYVQDSINLIKQKINSNPTPLPKK